MQSNGPSSPQKNTPTSTFYDSDDSGISSSPESPERPKKVQGKTVSAATGRKTHLAEGVVVNLQSSREARKVTRATPWSRDPKLKKYEHIVEPFLAGGRGLDKITNNTRLRDFALKENFAKELDDFMQKLARRNEEYGAFNDQAELMVDGLLAAESTTQITDLALLKEEYAQKGIELNCDIASGDPEESFVRATSGTLIEHERTLSEVGISDLNDAVFFQAYRLYLFLSGLKQGLTMDVGMLDAEIGGATGKAKKDMEKKKVKLEKLKDQYREKMSCLAMGLCHAAMKEEMPSLFSDKLYTALNLMDEKGDSHFRTDTIQPRDGWVDKKDLKASGYKLEK